MNMTISKNIIKELWITHDFTKCANTVWNCIPTANGFLELTDEHMKIGLWLPSTSR